jgi:nucleoside-diphosphate-sugar epimerase
MKERILVTGGCGYVGSKLVPTLLSNGYDVTVIDTQWFGNYLKPHDCLTVIKLDTRDLNESKLVGFTRIIHLANIANDPAVDLDQTLSWEVNVLATQQLIEKSVRVGDLQQFIFASSGSVYGVKDELDVTEELSLLPISAYNKTKMVAERVLKSYSDNVKVHSIRPATVCGLSPRMRLDVAVNLLTFQALNNGKITVFGGDQTRPNIHINDMVNVYLHFLENFKNLESGEYNAGFENISILDIANMVQSEIDCEIEILPSNDPRSYRQNSDKLLNTGFSKKYKVLDAILEIKEAHINGSLRDNDNFHTIKAMKKLLEIT